MSLCVTAVVDLADVNKACYNIALGCAVACALCVGSLASVPLVAALPEQPVSPAVSAQVAASKMAISFFFMFFLPIKTVKDILTAFCR